MALVAGDKRQGGVIDVIWALKRQLKNHMSGKHIFNSAYAS